MRKIEIPTDTPTHTHTEFEWMDTVADILRRREEREQREGGGDTATKEGRKREGGSQQGGNHTLNRRVSSQKACKGREETHRGRCDGDILIVL